MKKVISKMLGMSAVMLAFALPATGQENTPIYTRKNAASDTAKADLEG
ncbi:MAG: hypothetical protein ACK5Q1_13115 [Limnobacter sp.]